MVKEALHPSGLKISFFEKKHEYLVGNERYDSVTSLIKSNFPAFDADKVSEIVAKKQGRDKKEILAEWEVTRKEAASFGTKFHSMVETILIKKDLEAANHFAVSEKEKRYLEALKKAVLEIGKSYDFLHVEKIVFSPSLKIAGTIDVILQNKKTGSLVVADWKTNKKIDFSGFDKGLGPFKTLENCNFIHYSLQLSAYRHLLLREGYVEKNQAVNTALLHFADTGSEILLNKIKPKDLNEPLLVLLGSEELV